MAATQLHYVYDPLCGWCYAVAPLVKAAREVASIELHGGGMMTGARRQQITPAWREYVAPHDRQITQATGQQFGQAYLNGLLTDHAAWLDSEPPTAAVLAAEQVQGAGLDMLARLYEAHYVQGRRIADDGVLSDLAGELGLDRGPFLEALQSFRGEAVNAHFAESRDLLSAVGARGYPTFVIERNGHLERLDHTPFLGRPEAWQSALRSMKLSPPAPSQLEAGCGQNGCAI